MHIYFYTHTHAHAYICTRTHTHIYDTTQHAETLTPRLTAYAQICIPIHIHMYIHAYKYIYTCTCIYIHTCTSVHIRTYTHIRCGTQIQHVHMHTRTHAYDESAAATARGADADARSSAHLLRSTQSTTFGTSNARTSLYPLPETPIPLNSPSPLRNIPQHQFADHDEPSFTVPHWDRQQSARLWRSSVQLHNGPLRSHSVERLEGNQRYSRAPVREHADALAWDCIMWPFTRNERSAKTNRAPQAAHHTWRQRAAQTTPAHLHWCGAYPPGPWLTQAPYSWSWRRGGHPEPKLHFCHFRGNALWDRQ